MEVASVGDLHNPKCQKIYDDFELTVGKLKPKTAERIMRQIRESKDIAEICREWTSKLIRPTRSEKTNEDEDREGATEMSQMLISIQTLAGSPSSAMPLNSTHDTALRNLKNDDAEIVVSSHCCSPILKLFRTKKLISGEKTDLQVVTCKSKRSILLGHSDNVEVNIENLDGKLHFDISISQESKDENPKLYHGLYCWPRQGEHGQADLYLGEFSNGRFDGYGSVYYFDGGFFKGQWRQDMQQGFGVQRWKNGAVYFGQWENNREHGKGAYYLPAQQDPNSAEHPAKMHTYSLFIGDFNNGNPLHGVMLEGKNILEVTPRDITRATNRKRFLEENVSFGSCHAFHVLFDGRSTFWQRPTPSEKIGNFEAKVQICQFETRGLKRTLLRSEKIENVWYRTPADKTTSKEKGLRVLTMEHNKGVEESDAAVAMRQTVEVPSLHFTEKLYKIFKFRGTCVCNKAGIFPCPTKGTLYDEGHEFDAEYDGNSSLYDWPTPIRISGKYGCDVPSCLLSTTGSGKSVVERYLDDLAKIMVIDQVAGSSYQVKFKGDFRLQSFASHGIILNEGRIFKVEFDELLDLHRVVRTFTHGESEEPRKTKTGKKKRDARMIRGALGVDDDDYRVDCCSNTKTVVDFDKLLLQLKFQNKLVEIKQPSPGGNMASEILHPKETLHEAMKVLSFQLWSTSGALRIRNKLEDEDSNKETIKETWHISSHEFEETDGARFYGWFRKAYCPDKGYGKVLADGGKKRGGRSSRRVNMTFEDCTVLPGTQEWVVYFLRQLKTCQLFNLRLEMTQSSAEIVRIEAEISKQSDEIKKMEHTLGQASCQGSNEPAERNHIDSDMLASIHQVYKDLRNKISYGNDEKQDKKKFKTATAHVNVLTKSLAKNSLCKAYCDEILTNIRISEANSQFTAKKAKADLAAEQTNKALKNYDKAKSFNEEEIRRNKKSLNLIKENHSRRQNSPELNAENPAARKTVETAAKAIANARMDLEISQRSPDLAACTTYLARQTSQLLNLTLDVVKTEAELEAAMHDRSRARVFSKLALARKQELIYMHRKESGVHFIKENFRSKIAVLNEEHEGMKCTPTSHISDDNLLDLLGWSKAVLAAVHAEETVCVAWVQAAIKESSTTPIGLDLRAAEKQKEKAISESHAVFQMSAHTHSTTSRNINLKHGIKENTAVKSLLDALLTACKTSKICSIVRELASISLTVAQNRLKKSGDFTTPLPASDSDEYLKLLDAKLYTPARFLVREVKDYHDDTPSIRHQGLYAHIVIESAFSELSDDPPAISHAGHQYIQTSGGPEVQQAHHYPGPSTDNCC